MNSQSTRARNTFGVQAVVNRVRPHGHGVAGEGVRLGEVARCCAEHGELLGGGRHVLFCGTFFLAFFER